MFGWDFLLMLSRDSEDEMWSRFMFELLIWLHEATLARWTQSSGPLCLWQCFMCFWFESVFLHGWFCNRLKMICWLSARLFDVNQDAASLFEFNQIFTFGDFAELPSPTRQLPAGIQFNQSALPSLSSILSWADNHVGNKLKADYNIVSWHSFSLLNSSAFYTLWASNCRLKYALPVGIN